MEKVVKQKRRQSLFRRQFSRSTSEDPGTREGAYATAVAAAAFAIQSIEESKAPDMSTPRNGKATRVPFTREASQRFSFRRLNTAGKSSRSMELGRVSSASNRSPTSSIRTPESEPAAGKAEWFDKLKWIVGRGKKNKIKA